MSKIGSITLGLMATLILSATIVAPASAAKPEWVAEKVALKAGEKRELSALFKLTGEKVSRIKFFKNEIEVKCEEVELLNTKREEVEGIVKDLNTEAFIEGEKGGNIPHIAWSGCKVSKPAGCQLVFSGKEEDDIQTQELALLLLEEGGKVFVEMKPKAGSIFESFEIGGAGCAVKGNYVIKGSTRAEIMKPSECLEGHNLLINETPSKLKFEAESIELFEQMEIETEGLESDKCWGST